MKNNNVKIEQRLQSMKNFYLRVTDMIEALPDAIPEKTRNALKDVILGDKELKKLMDGIDTHRPPKIFLVGRTGVGKSSLINALCGAYVAKVSDTSSCTSRTNVHQCIQEGRVLMEILDTRGIAESKSLDQSMPAEDALIKEVSAFSPDVAILMLNCTHRDDVDSDALFLKKVAKKYYEVNKTQLPIIVVINKCDEMAPARIKIPTDYSTAKIENINAVVEYYKGIIAKSGLKINSIIPVSSLIDWKTAEGLEVSAEEIESLPTREIESLQIAFDGRYRIEELFDILEEAIPDLEAQMGLRMAARLNEVVERTARHLNKIFSGIAATVAATPLPVSDIYVLVVLQTVLVALIALLSGEEVSLDTAAEFIVSIGGITGAGYGFRLLAQQGSKFLNAIWPGAGSVVSSAIAAGGTSAVGTAAIAYYIKEETIEDAKKKAGLAKKN